MAIVRTGESAYDIEMQKWDTPKRNGGYGPDQFEPFPKMLYRAERRENGKVMCMDPAGEMYSPDPIEQARARAFTSKCQRTVQSEGEYIRAKNEGWCDTPDLALEAIEKHYQAISQAGAEENYRVQRMSEQARGEFAAADAATEDVLTEVPVPVKGPRGTRVKV